MILTVGDHNFSVHARAAERLGLTIKKPSDQDVRKYLATHADSELLEILRNHDATTRKFVEIARSSGVAERAVELDSLENELVLLQRKLNEYFEIEKVDEDSSIV